MKHERQFSTRLAALFLVAVCVVGAQAEQTVLRLWLRGPVLEAPADAMLNLFSGEFSQPKTLYEWVKTIHEARDADTIDGLILVIDDPQLGLAQTEELRRALLDFRAAGKDVYAYLDYADNLSYLLATAADHITLAEYSELEIVGLNASMTFYKGLLDKAGVEADLMHCGDYKSAVEPYTRTTPSDEAAEQMNWLLDGLYDRFLTLIAEGRHISKEQAQAAVDAAPLSSAVALERGMVDHVGGFPSFRTLIRERFGPDVRVIRQLGLEEELDVDFENPFALLRRFTELMNAPERPKPSGVALIYVDGAIMVGKSEHGAFGSSNAGSTTIRAALQEAMETEDIKAIVLRVDSPGGSALASDIIWDAATRAGKRKHVVVSMGDVAGSGGYYVSTPGDVVFAEESTITGSIGVLGGKLVWRGLMEDKLGVTTTEFARGRNAGLMSSNRPFDERERARVQQMLDDVYDQFKARVQTSRAGKLKGDINTLAGGRVYTGRQALERGLVDRIGGLNDAIEFAAREAGLVDPEVYVLPRRKDLFEEVLADLFGADREDEFEITLGASDRAGLWRHVAPLLRQLAPTEAEALSRGVENLLLLQREHVGCFMPFNGAVR